MDTQSSLVWIRNLLAGLGRRWLYVLALYAGAMWSSQVLAIDEGQAWMACSASAASANASDPNDTKTCQAGDNKVEMHSSHYGLWSYWWYSGDCSTRPDKSGPMEGAPVVAACDAGCVVTSTCYRDGCDSTGEGSSQMNTGGTTTTGAGCDPNTDPNGAPPDPYEDPACPPNTGCLVHGPNGPQYCMNGTCVDLPSAANGPQTSMNPPPPGDGTDMAAGPSPPGAPPMPSDPTEPPQNTTIVNITNYTPNQPPTTTDIEIDTSGPGYNPDGGPGDTDDQRDPPGNPTACDTDPTSQACACETDPTSEACTGGGTPTACETDPTSQACACEIDPTSEACTGNGGGGGGGGNPTACETDPTSQACACEIDPTSEACTGGGGGGGDPTACEIDPNSQACACSIDPNSNACTGGGSDDDDGECDPLTDPACGNSGTAAAIGVLYDPENITLQDVLNEHLPNLQNAQLVSAALAFFSGCGSGGTCPVLAYSNELMGQLSYTGHCDGDLAVMLTLGGFVVLAMAAFAAFRIAVY